MFSSLIFIPVYFVALVLVVSSIKVMRVKG